MSFNTKEELVAAIICCVPMPEQIRELDFSTEETKIYFRWRSVLFSVSFDMFVCEVDEVGCGTTTAASLLLEELIKRHYISKYLSKKQTD